MRAIPAAVDGNLASQAILLAQAPLADPKSWLLLADSAGISQCLAAQLRARGDGVSVWTKDADGLASLRSLLSETTHVVHLGACDADRHHHRRLVF